MTTAVTCEAQAGARHFYGPCQAAGTPEYLSHYFILMTTAEARDAQVGDRHYYDPYHAAGPPVYQIYDQLVNFLGLTFVNPHQHW